MQIQVVNKRAQRKYAAFVFALDATDEAFEEARKLIKGLRSRTTSYAVPDKDELSGALGKAERALGALHKSANKYEGELVSRNWRV